MTRSFDFHTLDVFTDRQFGGNPLAVFPDADGLGDDEMQALAAEMNLSETSFVLRPEDPAHQARVRIFNRTAEMPFAGHPNVGTGFLLACLEPGTENAMRFEEIAGIVEVRVERDASGRPLGAEIDAPQPLSVGQELDPADVARCLGLATGGVATGRHGPLVASVGVEFVLAEVEPEALTRAVPDLAAFRTAAQRSANDWRLSIFAYAPAGESVRARMFAPLSGTWEDPATGSASATLAALLLSLSDRETMTIDVTQGVEMGRPSQLAAKACRTSGEIHASVAGRCRRMLSGRVTLED